MREHERAILAADLPVHRLKLGDVGTVVHVYNGGTAYEVEFFTVDGQTFDVVTVEASQLRSVRDHDLLHARPLAA